MERIIKSAIDERVKISVDLEETTLKFVDNLGKLTKSSRTTIIEALIGKGAFPLIQELETTWKSLLLKGELQEKKKKNIKCLLENLEKSKEEWKILN